MDRDVEANFGPPQHSGRQFVCSSGGATRTWISILVICSDPAAGGKIHDTWIEKGGPDLQRMSHAHPVDLIEDVVRK